MVYRLHSLGRRVGAEACNIMEEQCNRWRIGDGGHEFFLTVLRALIGGREKREERKEG